MKTLSLTWITFGVIAIAGSVSAQTLSDSDHIWIEPAIKTVTSIAAHQKFTVAVMIENRTEAAALALPFSFAGHPGLRIDTTVGTSPDMVGVTYGPAGRESNWTTRTSLIRNNNQTILLGFVRWWRPGLISTRDTLCYIHFELDGNGISANVVLDTTALPPGNHLALTNIYAYDFIPSWGPGVINVAPLSAGDLDGDGAVTVSDIILLVNFVMKSGPAPAAMFMGDVDCDGAVSLKDIIWLVNFAFRNGPAPVADCGH